MQVDDDPPLAPDHRQSPSLDDQDVCRVCRFEAEPLDPLIHPCKCSGSVRYVHPECLRSWLSHSQKRYCEICGHRYRFTKIYPDFIPSTIPTVVFIRQTVLWLYDIACRGIRFGLAVIAWLIVLPSLNLFTLRSILWLADTIAHTHADQPVEPASSSTWQSWYTGQENTLPGFVFRGQLLSVILAGVILGLVLVREWIMQHNWTEQLRPDTPEEPIVPDEWVIHQGVASRVDTPEPANIDIAPPIEPQVIPRAMIQPIGAVPEPEWRENLEDPNWEREDWDGVLEVAGLIGPWHNLLQNVLFAVVIMGAGLTMLVGVPMIIGKLTLSVDPLVTGSSFIRAVFRLVRKVTDPIVDTCFEILHDVAPFPRLSPQFGSDLKTGFQTGLDSRFGERYTVLRSTLTAVAASRTIPNRSWCLCTGYIISLVALAIIAASRSDLFSHHVRFVKLALFMCIEMVIFPIVAGSAIFLSLSPIFDLTLAMALRRLCTSPIGTLFLNWLIGTSFMYAFSSFLSYIRSLVRPGTIFFIRDPSDASFSPVKDILDRPTMAQLRKLSISAGIYSFIIFALFGASTWSLRRILPIHTDRSPSSVPFDLLFVYLAIPPTINMVRPRHKAKRLWNAFWRQTTHAFALAPLMYGQPPRAGSVEFIWPVVDPFFQFLFGPYEIAATFARVPATDRVVLMPQPDRKRDGVFVLLDDQGRPKTPEAKTALLLQDRRARQMQRTPKDDYQMIWLPAYWRTRIHAFILCAIGTAGAALASVAYGPLVVGRAALSSRHDGYNYIFGTYVCLLASMIGRIVGKRIIRSSLAKRLRKSDSSIRFKRSIVSFVTNMYCLVMLYLIVPALVGLSIDLYLRSSSVIHIWDAWSIGLLILSVAPARIPLLQLMRNPLGAKFSDINTALFLPMAYLTPTILVPFALPNLGLPLMLAALLYTSRRWIHDKCLVLRQRMIDAEYVVEERVENYEQSDEWVDE